MGTFRPSAEQVEAMETDGTTAASDTVTGEEDYVDIDDLEEFDDEGPPPSDIDDDSGGDMMSDDDEHVQQGAEAEDDLVDEAETVFTGHTDAVYGVTICAAQPDRMANAGKCLQDTRTQSRVSSLIATELWWQLAGLTLRDGLAGGRWQPGANFGRAR